MGSVPISRCERGGVAEFHGRYHLSSGSPTWLAPTATIKDLKAARTLTFDDEFAVRRTQFDLQNSSGQPYPRNRWVSVANCEELFIS